MKMETQFRQNGCQLRLGLPQCSSTLPNGTYQFTVAVMCCLQYCQFTLYLGNGRVVGPQINRAHAALVSKAQPPVATLSTEPLVSLDITLVT